MKEYYIYLTILHHPTLGDLYYAGKNKSEGPEKDSKYRGSCTYPYWKKWLEMYDDPDPSKSLFQTRILQWFDNSKDEGKAETVLIQKCLCKHGSRLYGTYTEKGAYRSWLDQFGPGFCLNGHWNDGTAGLSVACSPEAIAKGLQTRIKNGSQAKALLAMHEAASTPEAREKAIATMRANGYFESDTFYRVLDALHAPDVTAKRIQTQKSLGVGLYDPAVRAKGQEAAQADDVKERRRQTQEERGTLIKWQQAGVTPESVAKAQKTREESGAMRRAIDAAHTPEANEKRMNTIIESGAFQKFIDASRAPEVKMRRSATVRANSFKYLLSDGFIGCMCEIVEHLSIPRSSAIMYCRKAKDLGRYYIKKCNITIETYNEEESI